MKIKKLLLFFFIIVFSFCTYSNAATFNTHADSALLVNTNTGKILYEKKAYEKMYPASTTKIMTAILVIENCDLNEKATVSEEAIKLPDDYVSMNMQPGESYTVNDLLHLLLIPSANDAANVLAEHIAGTLPKFAEMMNEKAREIGCTNTHFMNANGLDNYEHYTTAYDLYLIAKYAMQYETFRNIVSTTSFTMPEPNINAGKEVYNSNRLLHKINPKSKTENENYYEYATGIKTGFTDFAGSCLVASAKRDDLEYIAIILGIDTEDTNYYSERAAEAKKLLSTAIDNYSMKTIKNTNDVMLNVEIKSGNFMRKNIDLLLDEKIDILLDNSVNIEEIPFETILYSEKLNAPVNKGDVLGTVTYTYDGTTYTRNLIAAENVKNNDMIFILTIIAFILLFTLIVAKRSSRKRKKIRTKNRARR